MRIPRRNLVRIAILIDIVVILPITMIIKKLLYKKKKINGSIDPFG